MLLHKAFQEIPLDQESLPQNRLDIEARVRTSLFPWVGQFSPQLAEELLAAYAPRRGFVLDPFAGSGTSLVEAARLGLAACGCEINPAAVAFAGVYRMINLGPSQRETVLTHVLNRLSDTVGVPERSLFAEEADALLEQDELEAALVQLWCESDAGPAKDLLAALVVLCDFYRKDLDCEKVHRTWWRIDRIVRSLPESRQPIAVYHADARALPIGRGSVDLVLTSPPYINVHNYHQQFRRSVESLGLDVLSVARSEIGSNRRNRGNRFLTVTQYCLDMALALLEMARVAKQGARLILVLGRESRVRGTSFSNGGIVADLAAGCVGLPLERRQERVFRNRFGAKIYEDILHFRKTSEIAEKGVVLKAARHVAIQSLSARRAFAPPSESPGLDEAIARVDEGEPSPILRPVATLCSLA